MSWRHSIEKQAKPDDAGQLDTFADQAGALAGQVAAVA